jgi:hypothetical protein
MAPFRRGRQNGGVPPGRTRVDAPHDARRIRRDAADAAASGLDRRRLLGATAGGLALAASGRLGDAAAKRRPPHGVFRGIQLTVHTDASGLLGTSAAFYVPDHDGHGRIELAETRALTDAFDGQVFQTEGNQGILWIHDRYFIEVHNPPVGFTDGRLGYGGRIDASGWHGGTLEDSGLVGGLFSLDMHVDGVFFILTKLQDETDNYKVFDLHLR